MQIFKNISTTNSIVVAFSLSLILFTYLGIVEAKDFMGIVLMVLSYKFGRYQGKIDKPINVDQLG